MSIMEEREKAFQQKKELARKLVEVAAGQEVSVHVFLQVLEMAKDIALKSRLNLQ